MNDGVLPVRPKSKRLLKEENQSQNEYPGVHNGGKDCRQKNPEKLLLRAVHTKPREVPCKGTFQKTKQEGNQRSLRE